MNYLDEDRIEANRMMTVQISEEDNDRYMRRNYIPHRRIHTAPKVRGIIPMVVAGPNVPVADHQLELDLVIHSQLVEPPEYPKVH